MTQKIQLYNQIAKGYNSTRKADPYITQRLFELLSARRGKLYIDLGCGTGNYTTELSNRGIYMYGIDPSEHMLGIATQKKSSCKWLVGHAEGIPLGDALFDGGIATLTIHHWTNLNKAFLELKRVLKSRARLIIFTSTPEQMTTYWLNHYFPTMMNESCKKMPALADIEEAASRAGFEISSKEKYFIQSDLQDLFLYSGKLNPTIYFDENIRSGISSFTSFANKPELSEGLAKLRNDIEENMFERIVTGYRNDLGDYLFLVLKKTD